MWRALTTIADQGIKAISWEDVQRVEQEPNYLKPGGICIDPAQCEATVRAVISGRCRLRSALREANWSDCLPMIQVRNPDVVAAFVTGLEGFNSSFGTRGLVGVQGFEPPSWKALAAGERPCDGEPEEFDGTVMRGWQHEASSRVERKHGRLEVAVDGLPLSDGTGPPEEGLQVKMAWPFAAARRRKERRYPLVGTQSRAGQLARASARQET